MESATETEPVRYHGKLQFDYRAMTCPLEAMANRCSGDLSQTQKIMWLTQLIDAHMKAAQQNDNLSKGVFVAASKGNGSFVNSVIAALASIGHLHAPIWEARQVFFRNKEPGERIPGLGNSFFKDRVDPAFEHLWLDLPHDIAKRIGLVGISLTNKRLFPNAALITAAVCELIGYPDGLESEIFIHARLAVWANCWKQPPTLLA